MTDEEIIALAETIPSLVWTEGTISEEGALPAQLITFAHLIEARTKERCAEAVLRGCGCSWEEIAKSLRNLP